MTKSQVIEGRSAWSEHRIVLGMITTALLLLTPLPSVLGAATSVQSPNPPQGFPGTAIVTATGNALVSVVESSQQFVQLADGVTYHMSQSRSFGYTWGTGIASTERILFFSPNGSGEIEADVYVNNDTVQQVHFVNVTSPAIRFSTATNNYGGYSATFSSSVDGVNTIGEIQIPNSVSYSGNTYGSACCVFSQWTGVANGSTGNTYLTQGGVVWSGDNYDIGDANSYGYSLFVQELTSSSCGSSCNPSYISPPSWMNGVTGQDITMETTPDANCATGQDAWYEFWTIGSDSTSQEIACIKPDTLTYSYYVFEAPTGCSGGWQSEYCQIPDFSYSSGGLDYTCTVNGYDINHYTTASFYISQGTQDTSTSSLSGGDAFTESWVSSVN